MFGRKKHSGKASVQTVAKKPASSAFPQFWNSDALTAAERGLYSALREAVPVIDAAIGKIVRLSGGLTSRSTAQEWGSAALSAPTSTAC